MLDTNDLLVAIKRASIDATNALKPMIITFGRVESPDPIKVNVENRMTLEKDMLLVPKSFGEYELEVEIEGEKKKGKIDNKLKSGDLVIMLRYPGGQKYLIIDRVKK